MSASRGIITLFVMMAALMQIIDTTIVTVAESYMKGSLSANSDQISWVLTSYLISSGILMPLTGYFTDTLGRKRYLLISVAGFVAASVLCGLSTSLPEMVIFRLLQGVAGAALVPLAQATLVDIYPREQHGMAMAIFGLGAMTGPTLGPTLGGYLTQAFNWRWTFFVNVPVGAIAFVGILLFVPTTKRRQRTADWIGFGFLFLAVACMQFVLDKGNRDDWFDSHLIQLMTLLSVIGYIGFVTRCLKLGERAVVDLRLFKDRNFTISCTMFAVFMFSMYGALQMQPQFVESLLNFPTLITGIALAPRGITAAIAMITVGRIMKWTGPKPLILIGIILTAVGTLATTEYNLNVDLWWVAWPIAIQGFGIGFAFVPLATVAFSTIPGPRTSEAAGLRQLLRTIGASAGTSIATTIYTRQTQRGWNEIGAHISQFNHAVEHYLSNLHVGIHSPTAGAVLGKMLEQQSQMRAFLDVFYVLGWSVFLTVPLLFFIRYGKKPPEEVTSIAE